jgi:hypothetical protein
MLIVTSAFSDQWFNMLGPPYWVDSIYSRSLKQPPKSTEKVLFLEKIPVKSTVKGGDGGQEGIMVKIQRYYQKLRKRLVSFLLTGVFLSCTY